MKAIKHMSLFIMIAILFTSVPILLFSVNYSVAFADREIKSTYIQDFSNKDEIESDFRLCYQSEKGADSEWSTIGDTSATMRWDMDNDSNGNYVRCDGADTVFDNDRGAQGAAIMTYTGKKFVNFRLTVDYKKDDGTFFWPIIAFRQLLVGKVFNEDGIGAFVQKEGYITLWGCSDAGGPYESAPIANYEDGITPYEWHTIVIDMYGVDCNIYVDPIANPNPILTMKFSASMFRGGYISLIALNNKSAFRNLKIEEYSVERLENYAEDPIQSADTEDSIDNIIACNRSFSVKFFGKDGYKLLKEEIINYNGTTISPIAPESEDGYHFIGFYDDYGNEFVDNQTRITGEMIFKATYALNVLNITLRDVNNKLLTVLQVKYGETVEIPIPPRIDGYVFDGYYLNDEKLLDTAVFYDDVTYTARYSLNENIEEALEGWSMFGCGASINSTYFLIIVLPVAFLVFGLKRFLNK